MNNNIDIDMYLKNQTNEIKYIYVLIVDRFAMLFEEVLDWPPNTTIGENVLKFKDTLSSDYTIEYISY